jgi:hypothetical protein
VLPISPAQGEYVDEYRNSQSQGQGRVHTGLTVLDISTRSG